MNFDQLQREAWEWGDEEIVQCAEVDGVILYEVIIYRGGPADRLPKSQRYAVASCRPNESRWTAYDCADGIFNDPIPRGFPRPAMDVLRNLFELLP